MVADISRKKKSPNNKHTGIKTKTKNPAGIRIKNVSHSVIFLKTDFGRNSIFVK